MKQFRAYLVCFVLLVVTFNIVLFTGFSFAQKKTTLTVWCWQYQKGCIDTVLQDFYKANPGIEIQFRILNPGDLYQNLLLALSAGEGAPDITAVESSHLARYVEMEGLADITDNAKRYYHMFNRYKWADATKDGKIYAMPWDSGPVALYYRRDIFEKAGYKSDPDSIAKLLNTWEDYYKVAKVIKDKTGAYMFSHAKANNDGRTFEMLLWQQRLWYFDKNGKVTIDHPLAVKTLEYLGRFWKENLTEDTQPWTPGWYAGIKDGKVATIIGAVWMGGFMYGWIAPDAVGKWGVVPLPVWRATDVRTANDGGSNLAITVQCKDKESAWKFIEFITARKESQVAAWRKDDSFPSFEPAYSDPIATEPSPYFGGQAYRKVFVDLVKQIPPIAYTKDYTEANSILTAEIATYATGKKTASQALKDAATRIRQRTKRP